MLLVWTGALGGTLAAQEGNIVPGEILVRLKPEAVAGKNAETRARLLLYLESAGLSVPDSAIRPLVPRASDPFAQSIFHLRLPSAAVDSVIPVLRTAREIAWVSPNHVFRLHGESPNDSLFSKQWAFEAMHVLEAWKVSAGESDIPVAVIDTGIDYAHPDLQGQLWINRGEDLNNNDRADAEDLNGVDDDGNGYVDDVQGWDFTDAPTFVDAGDYLDPDNDPMDENGHGTAVAGIIAAKADNGIGIAGVAPGTRLMNLRAGTSLGFLEEDDVAAAILYAVNNGARVINMSFGDVVVSPLLRDVIAYAYHRGVVMVASSGNSGSDLPHYPSGFSETISVGAVTRSLAVAAFSNFGATLDVVAPGQEIWTTSLAGGYQTFSGTSAAAPFVSAVAALILARHPQWQPEQVRGVLTGSAQDLGVPAWDARYGAGLVDAAAALQGNDVSIAEIQSPAMNAGVSGGILPVVGTAAGMYLEHFQLSFGAGYNPQNWEPIVLLQYRQVIQDTLAFWDLHGLEDGIYTLRLQVRNQDGRTVEDRVHIEIDRSPPDIQNVRTTLMLDADRYSQLIEFETDDIARATLFWRYVGQTGFQEIPLQYETREHRYNFSRAEAQGRQIEFYVVARNRSGLVRTNDNDGRYYRMAFPGDAVVQWGLQEVTTGLPAGLLVPRTADYDGDGYPELALARYDDNGTIGPLQFFEWQENAFALRFETDHRAIPRDMGDGDGDGLFEILAGLGPMSFIYEAEADGGLPTRIVWLDSSNFWAARYADTDGDGRMEILGRRGERWEVLEAAGNDRFVFVDSLPNPTRGSNFTGVPHAEVADFDGDGRQEILLGDYDGDVYIYEAQADNRFQWTWADSLPLLDVIDFLTAGDFDGDGRKEFAVAAHSDPALNKEHEFDARHWLVRIYRSTGDNGFEIWWEQRIFGFSPPRDFDSGLGSGDIDGDGADELILSMFPDLYVIHYDRASGSFEPVWHFRTARSNTALVLALQRGDRVLLFSDGDQFTGFQWLPTHGVPAPLGVDAYPLDSYRVKIEWQAVAGATAYRVYRGSSADSLQWLAITMEVFLIDTTVVMGTQYTYAVTAVDSMRDPAESRLSRPVSATPGPGPRLLQAQYVAPAHVSLLFSEALDESARNPAAYWIDSTGHPASAALAAGDREVILTVPNLTAGPHLLRVEGLRDVDRTPLDVRYDRATFDVPPATQRFYLVSAQRLDQRTIRLLFNLPVNAEQAADTSRFLLSPPLRLLQSSRDPQDDRAVMLVLQPGSRIAPLGKRYSIQVRGLSSATGVPLEQGTGSSVGFTLAATDLSQVFVYPNPFLPARHGSAMIAGLPRRATIHILDEMGQPVRILQERDGDGGVPWDGTSESGEAVPSGIYIVRVTDARGGETFTKIAVLR